MTSHCRYMAPRAAFPSTVDTSYDRPKRWFIQGAVAGMTCINPMPWSHAMTVDRQLLSAQAIAFIIPAGMVMTGYGPPGQPVGACTPSQYCWLPAAASAVRTWAGGASPAGSHWVQLGASETGGGGGGGSCAGGGFSEGIATTAWVRVITGAGAIVGEGVGDGVGDGDADGESDDVAEARPLGPGSIAVG